MSTRANLRCFISWKHIQCINVFTYMKFTYQFTWIKQLCFTCHANIVNQIFFRRIWVLLLDSVDEKRVWVAVFFPQYSTITALKITTKNVKQKGIKILHTTVNSCKYTITKTKLNLSKSCKHLHLLLCPQKLVLATNPWWVFCIILHQHKATVCWNV